jgi:hypothetical protein
MFPKYQPDVFEAYQRIPEVSYQELSLRDFDNTIHLSDLSRTDIPHFRDARRFYKHNTRNMYLEYNGSEWKDVTLTYDSIYSERKKFK